MSLEILKLNKQVETAMINAGFTDPREIQAKTMSRILGGQDFIAVSPEKTGKSTAIILGVLMKLKYSEEHPPRALILVPTKEKATALADQFLLLGKNTTLKVLTLVTGAGIEGQREALAEGTDIVIGTPDRILTLYQKSGINLNKLKMLVLDDAEELIRLGFQTPIHLLNESLPKCQRLVFTEVVHARLNKLTDPMLNNPSVIESAEVIAGNIPIVNSIIYRVPNYKTKLNLLNLLMRETDMYPKVLVVTNTPYTAEKLYKSLNRRITGEVCLMKPTPADALKVNTIDEFLQSDELRVLLVSPEKIENAAAITGVPYTLHFDVPETQQLLVERIRIQENEDADLRMSITFVTDFELSIIKKAEIETGQQFPEEELPLGLIVEGDAHSSKDDDDEQTPQDLSRGGAFHEKKASNAKTHNYKFKDRLKMFGKKHRKNKRGI